MNITDKIYIAGHTGMVGSALKRLLHKNGYSNIIYRTHTELDLTNQQSVSDFFEKEKPDYVLLAAAKVGEYMQIVHIQPIIYQTILIFKQM